MTDGGAPRPQQNSDGQRKAVTPVNSRLSPQLSGSSYAQSPIPPTLGAGFGADLQGFPTDMAALQRVMADGYQPGAARPMLAAAQNAHALARAIERKQRIAQPGVEPDMTQLDMIVHRLEFLDR